MLEKKHRNGGNMRRNSGGYSSFLLIIPFVLALAACGGAVSIPGGGSGSTLISITTSGLPDGQVQVAYQATLAATGGVTSYTWSVASGQLPQGLALDGASGVIAGTPSAAGPFSFTIQVSDSSQPTAQTDSRTLALTIGSMSQLQITTNALATASIQQSYQATMSATGGVAPYTWRLASGLLPLGLMLGAVSGDISGTPTETGQFNITIEVTDSSQPSPQSATKAFTLSVAAGQTDQFGGILALPSPNGATGNWRVEKFGNRWLFVTPEGNAFWSLGVFAVVPTGNAVSKYGDRDLTWGPQQVRRLRSWGFNTILDHSNNWARPTASIDVWPGDHTQPEKMSQVWLINATNESWRNISNFAPQASKELMNGVDSTYYTGFRGPTPDPFDPNLEVWFQAKVQTQESQTVGNSPWTIGFSTAESDYVFGFGAGASADFATIPPGHNNPHLGYIVLITSPTQTENTTWGVTYADTTVYAKQALKDFLQSRYGTVAALNAAWSSNYSSFDSDGGWGRDNSSGALAQFGLLDENGSSPWVPGDWDNLSGATTAMKQDLDDYLFQHADKLFSVLDGPVRAQFPNLLHLGPNVVGSWMTPPRKQILQAAGNYIDAAMTQLVSGDAAEDQGRLDFFVQHFGDKPLATWLGIVANPDSALFNSPNPATQFPMNTQAERGQKYNEMLNALLNATVSSSGTKPFIGVRFWAHVDSTGEQANWGLVSPTDNAYDGKEAIVAPGVDPWGFPTGGEAGDYGDFLSAVMQAHVNLLQALIAELNP